MLVRGALCRLAGDLPKTSTHDLSHLARAFQNSFARRNALSVPVIHAISRAYRRTYATTAEATTPTPTVKKAVKKAAAAKKPAAKKTTAKKTTAKKTPAKKKTASKKAAPKKKKAKKTAAKKKPAAKKRAKKVLTPEEKEKQHIRELKKQALRVPFSTRKVSGRLVYTAEVAKGGKVSLKEAAEQYNNITPAEKEHYNHLANQQTETNRAEYRKWVHSHSPNDIRLANNARLALQKKLAGKVKSLSPFAKIEDDRAPKRSAHPFLRFMQERQASGDFKDIKFTDASTLISKEWAALSASEKKPYEDQSAEASARYAREYEQVYGIKSKSASA
ncbi:hypothetical protein BU24DRAFT_418374 [Aaosphaeria arxii CBS 175.79]|uniref:HMG box domain-containing protein n=1 Tax=Aaosphaeria arxii CBS 175.79 TaxID=1450172 RepID=A0A6A5Y1W5_9PLEO|nr:uncharacterized protein BU24DRAFT_418374 [Aaosphaeria arxii CBS 175.79]KAF2018820.1 hypothetical protein BU24DRAFT_418374 [Aaosphaeria arxii CBS 175.79]